jgi:hypothetical protein
VLAVVLLLATAWSANLALFNWWAAGGPPVNDVEVYELRGNVFGVVTVLLFVAFVGVTVMSIRRATRRT